MAAGLSPASWSDEQAKAALTHPCPICAATLPPSRVDLGPLGVRWVRVVSCSSCANPEDIRRDAQEVDRQAKEHNDRLTMYKRAFPVEAMGPRLLQATFDTWEDRPDLTDPEQTRSLANARRRAKHLMQHMLEPDPDKRVAKWGANTDPDTPPGLLLAGPAGSGKSHLGAAIAHAARERGMAVVWASVPDLITRLQGTAPEDRAELLRLAATADLLVLDEFGGGQYTANAIGWLLQLVDNRYRRMLPLVVTQNADPDEMERILREAADKAQKRGEDIDTTDAERIMDRLADHCRMIWVNADSYRQMQGQERKRRTLERG